MLKNILTEGECNDLRSLIDDAETIVVVCHTVPDGDAIGSLLGWGEVLKVMGKEPLLVAPDMYPDFLRWLPNNETIVRYDKRKDYVDMVLKIADLVFCLDLNAMSRTAEMETSMRACKDKMVIVDHHPGPEEGVRMTISHPKMSSTAEVVFHLAWELGLFPKLGAHFATAIYCGMMTDTGAFTFNSNSPEVFSIVSELLTKQIDKDRIYRQVYHTYSEDRLRLQGYILYEKLVTIPERHAAYYALTRKDLKTFNYMKGDTEGVVNMPLQMKGVKLSISLREDTEKDNFIMMSLRSVDDFPCNQMAAEFFNGGGHLNAAGGRLYCSMEEAVEKVRQAIEAYADKLK